MSRPSRKLPKSRAEAKQATRVALLDAGIREISAHGLDASLDAICARAKLTRGAFYVHFADREAFLVAVMEHVLGGFVQSLAGAAQAPRDLATAVRTFFAAAGTPVLHPAGRAQAGGLRFHHVMEACRRSPAIGEAYRRIVKVGREQIAALIARDQAARSTRADVAAGSLADMFVIAALGTAALLELELPIDHERLGATLLSLVSAA
jgi:TetR/AcrR family transcriptional repressor of nem operon